MFQAPRPVSHAPIHSHFTPSHFPFPLTTNNNAATGNSHHHTVAVPLATHHKPIAISTHRGSGSGGHSGPNSGSSSNRSLNPFVGRVQQSDPTIAYSPSASPGLSLSASASPALHMSHAGNIAALGNAFSLSTPSPPPSNNPTHEFMFTPSSPLMSPHDGRRDSIDDAEAANAHLQGILWRNAQTQLKNVAGVKHVSAHGYLHGQASPMKPSLVISPVTGNTSGGALAGAFSASHNANNPTTPTTQGGMNSPNSHAFSRAIPIAKGRTSNNAQPSILQQLQFSHSERDEHLSSSREGSRRGSASGHMMGSSPHTTGSFVLSHTPPVRANNPLENDSCFSPAQQAEYLMRAGEGGVLPMMMSSGYREQSFRLNPAPVNLNAAPSSTLSMHSPVRVSTLSQSLAQRHFHGNSQANALLSSKFAAPQLNQATADVHANILHTEEDNIDYPKLSCTL